MAAIIPAVLGLQGGNSAVAESTAIGLYSVYALVAIGLVVFLARTLSRNGAIFLKDVFDESQQNLAGAVNQLLVVGFYLLNLGYALLIYRLQTQYSSVIVAFNELVVRLGTLLLSLGVIHMLNMVVFWKIRNAYNRPSSTDLLRARLDRPQPPAPEPHLNFGPPEPPFNPAG